MKPHVFSFSFLALHSEEAQLPFCPCDALRNARVGTGVDDVVEGLFTDGITGIDVTAQDFPVRQSAAGMFVVNTYDFPYPVRITHSCYFLPAALFHIVSLLSCKITNNRDKKRKTSNAIFRLRV